MGHAGYSFSSPHSRRRMSKLRVFVSSVQQELENERVAIAELISTDQFLSKNC